ncbi:MAG: DUF2235 domain-containing protein [Devosiaceae bacterium]|nr:DUF2235 domain-containing protein [Devosiaceae bacterium MH13]
MKRIIILCDGTWNRADNKHPTNVVKVAQSLLTQQKTTKPQVPLYIEGVGSGRGSNALQQGLDRARGGMFGDGLLQNIADAYQHLVFLYEPGDELFFFGFSRGAFTARSLVGLIRSTGIVERDQLDKLPIALARYRQPKSDAGHPDSEESHAHRLEMSPKVVTSPDELDWRLEQGKATPDQMPALLRIKYLGVWDTVGSLGVPFRLTPGGLLNRRHRFHDTSLTELVEAARHAVALDERRKTFAPTLWTNVGRLNAQFPSDPLDYQQVYFAGDHGSVGGGGDITGLSDIALTWMLEGAEQAGMEFDHAALKALRDGSDPLGSLVNSTEALKLYQKLLRIGARDRDGPETVADVHRAVLERIARPDDLKKRGQEPYKPASLGPLVWPSIEMAAATLDLTCDDRHKIA